MNDFVFYSPTEFIFGKGVTDQVGEHIAKRGYKRAARIRQGFRGAHGNARPREEVARGVGRRDC